MAEGDMIVTIPKKIDFINCGINPEYKLILQMTAKRNGVAEVSVFFQNQKVKINTDEKLNAHLININPCPPVLGKRFNFKKVEAVTDEMMERSDISAVITFQPDRDRLRVTIVHNMDAKYIQGILSFVPTHKLEKNQKTILRTRSFGYEFVASKMPKDFFSNTQAVAACD